MSSSSLHLLQNVYVFKELSAKELEPIEALAKTSSFIPGDEIFSQGDVATALYIVKFGSVQIKHTGKEDAINVANLGTGAHFGEMAFVDGEKRSASVSVIEPTEILTIDFKDLRRVLDANPVTAMKVYKSFALYLCGRLRVTTNDLSFAREKNMR